MSEEKGSSGRNRTSRQVGPYLSISFEFMAAILLCLGIGWWIDKRFGTTPAFTLVGAFLGLAAGFYHLFRTVMDVQKRNRKDSGPEETDA